MECDIKICGFEIQFFIWKGDHMGYGLVKLTRRVKISGL